MDKDTNRIVNAWRRFLYAIDTKADAADLLIYDYKQYLKEMKQLIGEEIILFDFL